MITPAVKNRIEQAVRQSAEASDPALRRESLWLKDKVARFSILHNCKNRDECDSLLYELTFRKKAVKSADAQKIRFWRTGRYYPRNREICNSFAEALELSEEERLYLLRQWYERSDAVYTRQDTDDPEYLRRLSVMERMKREFLMKITPEEAEQYGIGNEISENSLRYLYCLSAQSYLYPVQENARVMIQADTASYASRFALDMKLLGEISRTSMTRHIIVLSAPYINSSYTSEKLEQLGYAPLDKGHLSPAGYARDLLLCGLLEIYEEVSCSAPPRECAGILKEIMSYADKYMLEQGKTELSVMRSRFLNI